MEYKKYKDLKVDLQKYEEMLGKWFWYSIYPESGLLNLTGARLKYIK